ncbi:OLC1v1033358C1 [Oldenlandia corymbosa var. corymbosa]|uniref:OLC1v1033358C1 n=1 Tax=Oldenlandia corymbosa var. corymbosa TaxID=529605 RepID=A0AAV1CQS6_OLDCO|nr:OLC1v1033358C1 [Oldenlandia corymbosa var. corymbosa]
MAQNQPRFDQPFQRHHQPQAQQLSHQVAKTTTAVTLGGSLMVLSGLTLTGTVIGLVLLTPLLVIFSPVLVPAAITLFLITAGLITSGGLGATASFLFYWMYRYATGKHPIGADQIDRAKDRIAHAAKEMRDKAEHYGHQTQQHIKSSQDI